MKYVLMILFFILGFILGQIIDEKAIEWIFKVIFFPFIIIGKPFYLLFKGVHKDTFEKTLKMMPDVKAIRLTKRIYLVVQWKSKKITNKIYFLRVKKNG